MGSCCGADREAVEKLAGDAGVAGRIVAVAAKIRDAAGSWWVLALSACALVASFALNGHGCGGGACARARVFDPAWIALVACGLPIVYEAVLALVAEKRIRAALLMSIAMVSCVAIGQYFAAGEIAFIMGLGEKLEGWTVGRAKKGIGKLVSLLPATARYVVTCPKCLARGEKFRDVPPEKIEPGDGVRILPGETVPVDGVITEGSTTVDQSAMTGESLPVDKTVGDEVYSGTVNRFGAITIRATKAGADSSLQMLVGLVKEAEKKKAPMQRIADRWAAILVPVSMCIALATFAAAWPLLGDFHAALVRGVTVMVVFCPCALALATPTSIMAAIGQATKHGVIIKSGEALERMGGVDTICFDKTGTLTAGRLSVSAVRAYGAAAPGDVLRAAAAAEASSEHPVAAAILEEAKAHGIEIAPSRDFVMEPGRGIAANCDTGASSPRVLCGNAAWLEENGVAVPAQAEKDAEELRATGKAVVLVASGGAFAGVVALADTVRQDAKTMLDTLHGLGVRPVLLTGDHASTARHVAGVLGISDVRAALAPAQKAQAVSALQGEGRSVAMVGDGVNDAPALKTAAVGVAMGSVGCDIAVEAADIALVGDDLSKLPYLKRLADACVRLVKINIAISMCINAAAITCSILGLLTPVTGALVHNMGSLLVILNAALLYDREP